MITSLPLYAKELFKPYRYKVLRGGRGSSKSHTVARVLLMRGRSEVRRVLCAREFQNSISESVHKLLVDLIYELHLDDFYTITQNKIYGRNGTEFIFKGLFNTLMSIKSMEGITDLWLEEAQTVSEASWSILIPTIRSEGSEIWVTYNPENESDPTHTKFVDEDGNSRVADHMLVLEVNWNTNPFFPEVLRLEKDYLYEVDPELASHVWGGEVRSHSDKQIFKGKWSVQDFEVDLEWSFFLGADWGFSIDPTCLIACYVDTVNLNLMIRYESLGHHVEFEDIPELFDNIPVARHRKIWADCARPETISYVARKGFDIEGASKWSGSIEDGIEFIRSFRKIIIHPSCTNVQAEFKNYSYKVDRLSGAITTDVVDAHNHCIDALRYSLVELITAEGFGILGVL